MSKKYTEWSYTNGTTYGWIINIPKRQNKRQRDRLEKKKTAMVNIIGGERAKQKQPEIT
jgi:hypothetical protein